MKEIILTYPYLKKNSGHERSFIDTFQFFAKKHDYKFSCFVPSDCSDKKFQNSLTLAQKKDSKFLSVYYLLKDLFQVSRKTRFNIPRVFVFDCFYSKMFFTMLFMALFFTKKKDHFFLVFRYAPEGYILQGKMHAFILKQISKRFTLFTDSLSIQEKIQSLWHLPCNIYPIPFSISPKEPSKTQTNPLICWWPGIFRAEKGLYEMQKLTQKVPKHFVIKANQKANLSNIDPLPEYLTNTQYIKLMETSHIILLPYQGIRYVDSTSNIFIEAILHRKVLFVSKNTWMSFELERFDLHELIIDWDREDFFQVIEQIYHSSKTHEKLDKIYGNYFSFYARENTFDVLNTHMLKIGLD